MAEVEETCKKIQAMKGVEGVIVLNNDGIPIKSTMGHQTTVDIACNILSVVKKAWRVVKDLDNTNELTFLRLHSKVNEIMCAVDTNYVMVVVQRADKPDAQPF